MDQQHSIFEGRYTEEYTPTAGRIISPKLNKKLKWVKFMVSVDSDVTFKDGEGSGASIATYPMKAGVPYPFFVSEISAASASARVLIFHDGELSSAHDGQ